MHTTTRSRWSATGTALVVALAVAACGSDEEPGGDSQAAATSAETSAAADPAEFCEAAVDVESAAAAGPPIDETTPPAEAQAAMEEFSARLGPLLERAQETAPEEVADDVATSIATMQQALSTGDMAPMEGAEFMAADDAIDEYMLAECGYEQIEVTGVDYEYEGVPDSVPSGVVAVTFRNEGEELHEIGIVRIDDDVDMPLAELAALPPEQSESMVQFAGAAFAAPGESDTVFLRMEPGRYGAGCFVPQGTTPEAEGSGPPHLTLGMLAEFQAE
ncbi:hypothetical protein [Blastococcus saxobsidens]|uniref:Lipoprotein n=1 Tax=Blastococcus saxobsidens TaxID=138336 RepID=A0A4Q7Y5R4_9ACTN|nr:hypothetical protein [Blastococcus saxobsidens]RZU31441.1 hypothetical protein BKA19_1106 [Blastococcus saxobsidens]